MMIVVPPILSPQAQAQCIHTMYDLSSRTLASVRSSDEPALSYRILGTALPMGNPAVVMVDPASSSFHKALESYRLELDTLGLGGQIHCPSCWVSEELRSYLDGQGITLKVEGIPFLALELSEELALSGQTRSLETDADARGFAIANSLAHGLEPHALDPLAPLDMWGGDTFARLIEVDGEIVATAAVYLRQGLAHVGWVATVPAAQKRGYGRQVTNDVMADAQSRGAFMATLTSTKVARPMYESLGFRHIGDFSIFSVPPRASA